MVENNYEVLGIHEGATKKEIQEAFRRLALLHHSDRGGDVDQFKRIKQAYEDLKEGKKYADSSPGGASNTYTDRDEAEIRHRNKILAEEISREMRTAQEWAAAHRRCGTTGVRLFGSKTLGEMEFEVKANGALSIKGNIMAGSLEYDGPVVMQGNITSPTFGEATCITVRGGDFKFLNPLENKYSIKNGTMITVERGNIVAGNIFGNKTQSQDPEGRVGVYVTTEHRTRLVCPGGKIVIENAASTVDLEGDSIMALNLEDDVRVSGKDISIYGNKLTYDVAITIASGGTLKFFERNSVLGLSDDALVVADGGGTFALHDLKTKKIRDLPEGLVPPNLQYSKDDTLVGKGFPITHKLLCSLGGERSRGGGGWRSRISGWK